MDAISGTVGNYAHKELKDSLNRATQEMLNKKKASPNKPVEVESTKATPVVAVAVPVPVQGEHQNEESSRGSREEFGCIEGEGSQDHGCSSVVQHLVGCSCLQGVSVSPRRHQLRGGEEV